MGLGPGAVKGWGSLRGAWAIFLGFTSSGRRRLPEVLWDTTKQEIQKLVSFVVVVVFFKSAKQSKSLLKQTFFCSHYLK